jgi:hypothetical protein
MLRENDRGASNLFYNQNKHILTCLYSGRKTAEDFSDLNMLKREQNLIEDLLTSGRHETSLISLKPKSLRSGTHISHPEV